MKHGELAKKLGCSTIEIVQIRKSVCEESDYNAEEKQISPAGVGKIMVEYDRRHKVEEIHHDPLEPHFVKFRVLNVCANPCWVDGYVEGRVPRKKVRCHVPRIIANLMRPNAILTAQEIEKNGKPYYRHEKSFRKIKV